MTELFLELREQLDSTTNIVLFALIMARVMAIVVLVPFLGGRNAPTEVKMGIGATLTFVLWPTVLANLSGPVPLTPLAFIIMMLKEVFVGLVIGFVTAKIFYTVEIAGQLIDILRGANQIQVQVPEISERSSAFGTLNYQLLLALFLSMNMHVPFINTLFESFVKIPVNAFPEMHSGFASFTEHMLRIGSQIIETAVVLAVPIGFVCLIAETAFGLMNKVAPQINAYFMAMPAKVLAGCVVFFMAFNMILETMLHHAQSMLHIVQESVELMR